MFLLSAGHGGLLVVGCVSMALLPRIFGADDYGLYVALLAVVAVVQAVSTGGLPVLETRLLTPMWRADSAEIEVRATRLAASLWTLRLLLSALAGVAVFFWLVREPLDLERSLLLAAGLFAALRAGFEATRSQLLPLGRVRAFVALDVARAVSTLAFVLLAYLAAGLAGVMVALPFIYGTLFLAAVVSLRGTADLRLGRIHWGELGPQVGFCAWTGLATIASILHQHFAVFATAAWVEPRQAALVAIALQLAALPRGFYQAARRALQPMLAELQAAGESQRLVLWASTSLRYCLALTGLAVWVWACLGGELARRVLGTEFEAVHRNAAVLLLGVIPATIGGICNDLLLVAGRGSLVALTTSVHAAVVLLGLGAVMERPLADVTMAISWCYLLGSVVFGVTAYLVLGLADGRWLPMRPLLALSAPCGLALAMLEWRAPTITGAMGAAITGSVVYLAFALGSGLLSTRGSGEVARHLLKRVSGGDPAPIRPGEVET